MDFSTDFRDISCGPQRLSWERILNWISIDSNKPHLAINISIIGLIFIKSQIRLALQQKQILFFSCSDKFYVF